ncbi:36311_t:CDS:1, partial [Racocetra persica]
VDLNQYEIDKYLTEIETEAELLHWWKASAAQFPTLSRLAMDFLAMQATSVPSEQAFSVAKHTISLTRNRINPEVARTSLCLKSWYRELGDILNEVGNILNEVGNISV